MALSDVLSEVDALLRQAEKDYPDSWAAHAEDLVQARCRMLLARMTLESPPGIPADVLRNNPIFIEAAAGDIAFYDAVMDGSPDVEARMNEYASTVRTELQAYRP